MPRFRTLALAVVISILVHLGLGIFFWSLSLRRDRFIATLSEAGGVIWFNLHPGGSGSGGEGGRGLPQPSEAGQQGQAAPKAEKAKPVLPRTSASLPTARESEGRKEKAVTRRGADAARPPAPEKIPEAARGPGEGDAQGSQSGLGGGSGSGSGGGQGGGEGEGRGPGGTGPLGSGGSGTGGDADATLARIRNKIARAKRYPRQARSEGVEGTCGLEFQIQGDGSLSYVRLTRSSGHQVLDEEALATVRRAAPFPFYEGAIRFSLRFSLKDL